MLQKHEKMSKLHLENVAKQNNASTYRDRAQERRDLLGEEEAPVAQRPPPPPAPIAPTVSVDQPISSSCIGNQLLRKMGWKQGAGLGKTGTGITAPVVAKGQTGGAKAGLGTSASNVDPSVSKRAQAQKRVRLRMFKIIVK